MACREQLNSGEGGDKLKEGTKEVVDLGQQVAALRASLDAAMAQRNAAADREMWALADLRQAEAVIAAQAAQIEQLKAKLAEKPAEAKAATHGDDKVVELPGLPKSNKGSA